MELSSQASGTLTAQLSASRRVTRLTSERLSNRTVRGLSAPVSQRVLNLPNPGAYATGKISDEERLDVIRHACPGSGACGGMFTCAGFHLVSGAFLKSTHQCQHDGNCPRSFRFGPSVLLWNPRRLPWSVDFNPLRGTRTHFLAEKAQESLKAPKYLKNLMELDLKPKFVRFALSMPTSRLIRIPSGISLLANPSSMLSLSSTLSGVPPTRYVPSFFSPASWVLMNNRFCTFLRWPGPLT